MKLLAKTAAVLALVLSVGTSANAQTYPDPTTNPDGGALIVSIWDPIAGVSLVYAIPGTLYQQTGALAGFTSAIPDFSSVFGGSSAQNINYQVAAAGLDENGRGALYATGPDTLPAVNSGNVAGTFLNAANFYGQLVSNCGTGSPCISTNPQDGHYSDQPNWGDLSAQLPFSASTTAGNALAFYSLAQADGSRVRPTDPARVAAVGGGLASWLLDAAGNLTYSVVPLPAAAWLLLSGLIGFGAISRRGQNSDDAAAAA